MILFQKSSDLTTYIRHQKSNQIKIGFVPTMGAIHAGHLSLIKKAKEKCDLVVCSIFVNPTQFNQASDLENYPRPIENDLQLLTEASCDVLFHPDVNDIYGSDLSKESSTDYGPFIHMLEGNSRPGHFDGVVTIVRKLFNLVQPDEVFFGQKDYQQCLVVETLIKRHFTKIRFNICPIERESDGLAMSSRNVRLTEAERKIAPQIFQTLQKLVLNWNEMNWHKAVEAAKIELNQSPFHLEYLSICSPQTLVPLENFENKAIVLVAVQLGSIRLIDNMFIH